MNEQEKIDRRLLNQMSKAEQAAFDKELSTNSDLADSFEFNQDMADFFTNENPDLENKLDVLGDNFFSKNPPQKKGFNKAWFWFIPLILLSGGVLSYFFFDTTADIIPTPNEIKIENSITPPDTKQEEFDSKEVEVPVQKNQEKIDEQKKEVKKPNFYSPPKEEKSAPIAVLNPADFAVNPTLEGILRENVRDNSVTTLSSPVNEAILEASANSFTLTGTTNVEPPYILTIYSNRVFDFDNDYPALRREVLGKKIDDDFVFDFNAKTSFPPGLYYLLLQDERSELMSISKFVVK